MLALLARELPKLINAPVQVPLPTPTMVSPRKRARTGGNAEEDDDEDEDSQDGEQTAGEHSQNDDLALPATSASSLEPIVAKYFSHIHPWIPMLHQDIFRAQVAQPSEIPKIELILYAMIFSTARFLRNEDLEFDIESPTWSSEKTRRWIISKAMDRLCVESLQTLIIMAFTDVGYFYILMLRAPPRERRHCASLTPDAAAYGKNCPRSEAETLPRPGLSLGRLPGRSSICS